MINESLLKKLEGEGQFNVCIKDCNGNSLKEYNLSSFNECLNAVNYYIDEHIERPPYETVIKRVDIQVECHLNESARIVSIEEY